MPETRGTATVVSRAGALPDSSRLLEVCTRRETAVTPLEFAVAAFAQLWETRLTETDLPVVLDTDRIDQLVCATEDSVLLARMIDDEVCWQLGNDADSVELIAEGPRAVTVGEFVGRIALLSTAYQRWPDLELVRALLDALCSRHDVLVRAVLVGQRRAPRRRSHGVPPLDVGVRLELLTSLLRPGQKISFRYRMPAELDGTPGQLVGVSLQRPSLPTPENDAPARGDTGSGPGSDGPAPTTPRPSAVSADPSTVGELADEPTPR